MLKWILIILGIPVLLMMAVFAFFIFSVWKLERDYPKSFLPETSKGICVVATKDFVLVKIGRGYIGEKVFDFLPKPDGSDYIYDSYSPGTVRNQDGTEGFDLTDAIEIKEGDRFRLLDGFINRTINGATYYFQLEPEKVELDSTFFYSPIGLAATEDNSIKFLSEEEMAQFDHMPYFKKSCDP